jgi:hypothetical protein
MKHILLSLVSLFHHHQTTPKPSLDTVRLDRAMMELSVVDEDKVICVYPMPAK